MTTLEQLEVNPKIVRELQAQFVDSVEDLVALSAQPNEREALLADMNWTELELQALLEEAEAVLEEVGVKKAALGQSPRAVANHASMNPASMNHGSSNHGSMDLVR